MKLLEMFKALAARPSKHQKCRGIQTASPAGSKLLKRFKSGSIKPPRGY